MQKKHLLKFNVHDFFKVYEFMNKKEHSKYDRVYLHKSAFNGKILRRKTGISIVASSIQQCTRDPI